MVDFKNYIKNLTRKYLVIERHFLAIQGILLQYLKFNYQIITLQIFYITFKIKHIIACSRFISPFEYLKKRGGEEYQVVGNYTHT